MKTIKTTEMYNNSVQDKETGIENKVKECVRNQFEFEL